MKVAQQNNSIKNLVIETFNTQLLIVNIIRINIEIETNENQSVFRIKNTYSEILKSERESLGLNNIEEQLKIFYNNQFEFNILQSENWFSVEIITPATE